MQRVHSLASMVLPVLFSLALFGVSAYALRLELTPFTSGLTSPVQRFSHLEKGGAPTGLSILAQQLVLNDCLEAIAGPTGKAQPTSRRFAMLRRCQSVASNIVETSPSFALAWFVAANASIELGQIELFNSQLGASHISAPNEQWLAELRVNLAEANFDSLTVSTRAGHERDLRLLVKSRLGVASIALRYVTHPEFKDRITNIVETLGEEEQQKFVTYVRVAARGNTLSGVGGQ